MTVQEFFDKYNNKGVDYDGYYGFQCMDLAHQFAVEVVGQDIPSAPAAKDVWQKDCPGYEKITNTPDGVPQKGDIVIWGAEVGPYGHIAVFDHGDINSFTSFDQNWPVNSLCHLQNHSYKGVLGWLRPKRAIIPQVIAQPEITDQTKIPQINDMEVQAIRSVLNDQARIIRELDEKLKKCQETPSKAPETALGKLFSELARYLG